jgi:transcriptional regulator with XRE-family HTH domain/anti-sigma regulatory factor (Ser/Thr protein kinase)
MSAEIIPLGARLRRRREELGLSQTQAAQQLEVARTAYRLWELEAARPAPDRWRVIAKWLGVSTTALLLADELIDEQEALAAERVARGAGLTDREWDAASDASSGDYFSQERAMIADQVAAGAISAGEAARLRSVVARMQEVMGGAPRPWHPGRFVKRLPRSDHSPALARNALHATAFGIPDETLATAELLTSELVTNAVRHTSSDSIEIAITLDTERLRVTVSDESRVALRPRSGGIDGGWGLLLVAELATRWGVERHPAGKTVWIELDTVVP